MPARILMAAALLASLAACQSPSEPTLTTSETLLLRSGLEFGECWGYCRTELRLDGDSLMLIQRGWRAGEFPDRAFRAPLAPDEWRTLRALFDRDAFLALDTTYGCPDCADGGAEWVEVQTDALLKRVTFENGEAPQPIERLAGTLRRLRERALAEAGWQ